MLQFDLAVFFAMRLAPRGILFGEIELNHVARPVEGILPINTMYVYLSVRK